MKSAFLISSLGKAIGRISRIRGGHGSALPGLVAEKIAPHFLRDTLATLPRGVAVISGTNGKTTTTKMVVELLRESGLKVFTNDSGSNFTRGVASAAIREMRRGKLDADIAILELDEAHAVHFVRKIPPQFCLLLNILRDQLDRFGEIDTTAKFLQEIAEKTTQKVVLNYDDPRLIKFAKNLSAKVSGFGFAKELRELFPTDEELHTSNSAAKNNIKTAKNPREITLQSYENSVATYEIDGRNYAAKLQLFGAHNALNAAAALALVREILGDKFKPDREIKTLGSIKPAFGRGEIFRESGREIRLILVKNPSGFRLSLNSADSRPTAIFINDAYADGRDVSWLYDVNFREKLTRENTIFAGGIRAYDMALRLELEDIECAEIIPEIRECLTQFLRTTAGQNAQIFATYTAMLEIRKLLKRAEK